MQEFFFPVLPFHPSCKTPFLSPFFFFFSLRYVPHVHVRLAFVITMPNFCVLGYRQNQTLSSQARQHSTHVFVEFEDRILVRQLCSFSLPCSVYNSRSSVFSAFVPKLIICFSRTIQQSEWDLSLLFSAALYFSLLSCISLQILVCTIHIRQIWQWYTCGFWPLQDSSICCLPKRRIY